MMTSLAILLGKCALNRKGIRPILNNLTKIMFSILVTACISKQVIATPNNTSSNNKPSTEEILEIELISQNLSNEIMSPYCPGRTLSACPSNKARNLRDQIEEQLLMGYSVEAIKRQLISKYGTEILGKPKLVGFGFFAWLAPVFFFIIGGILIAYLLAKRKKDPLPKEEENKQDLNDIEDILKN